MMQARSLMLAGCLILLSLGGCTWPPKPALPPVPADTAQATANDQADAVGGTLDQTLGTAGRGVQGLGGAAGGVVRSAPSGGLLR